LLIKFVTLTSLASQAHNKKPESAERCVITGDDHSEEFAQFPYQKLPQNIAHRPALNACNPD
jgi:hypothetical protein